MMRSQTRRTSESLDKAKSQLRSSGIVVLAQQHLSSNVKARPQCRNDARASHKFSTELSSQDDIASASSRQTVAHGGELPVKHAQGGVRVGAMFSADLGTTSLGTKRG